MSYDPKMQKGSLDAAKADTHGLVKKESVELNGVTVTRVTSVLARSGRRT
jgi:hypothetical protein